MNLTTLQLGELGTNCYLLDAAGNAVLIDPGAEPARVQRLLQARGLTLAAIVLTHGHFDHVGAVRALHEATGCRVYLNPVDATLPPQLTDGPLCWTDDLHDGDTISVLGQTVQVIGTPGHTPGSVCLRLEDWLFTGDTLFAGSCGRTDFPGGSYEQMLASLRRLAELPGDARVLPGHGDETTLALERAQNYYIREALRG